MVAMNIERSMQDIEATDELVELKGEVRDELRQ